MGMWNKVKSISKTTVKVKDGVKKGVDTTKDFFEDGAYEAAKKALSKKGRQKAFKAMAKAGKTVLKFLATPPWGWVVSAVLLFTLFWAVKPKDIDTDKLGAGNSNVTTQQYAAMMAACGTGGTETTGSVSGSINMNPTNNEWTLEQVTKFSTSPLTSTWKISDNDAANYFLTRNTSVATRYGLNKSNIGEVTAVVKNGGVSPAFFYLYAVNEGGGAGGFINHYMQSAMTGDVKMDAKMDVDYLVEYANMVGGHPATEVWSLGNMPTEKPQKILDDLPMGSIGRVYLQATAAVTAEFNELAGIDWPRVPGYSFGRPVSDMMNAIESLGGDITAADQIDVGTGSASDNELCKNVEDADASLKSGGLTLEEARKFMMDKYQNVPITEADIPGALPGTPEIHDNCTAFSAFFVNKYTTLKTGGGNGMDVAAQLVTANPQLKMTHTPTVYSVFSIAPFGGPGMAGDVGHTGVVLGIDKDRGVAIIGQAAYGMAFTNVTDWGSGVNAQEVKLDTMTEANGWSFTDVSEYMKDLK